VKFTSFGEVSIRVKLETPGEPEWIRFEVNDTGIGVPSDKRDLLFQPFSQVDNSTSRQFGGTGLGLSIVRMLVEMMGGSVGCDSEEGRGSSFWFTVPLDQQESVERPQPLSLAGRRILVVDDNARSRSLTMELLTYWKARAREAADAEQALDLLRSTAGDPFDAVLLDLEMPGMDGEQLGKLILRQPGLSRPPLILLTPLDRSTDAGGWRRLGFAGHVAKPVKQGELGKCLASVLGYGPAPVGQAAAAQKSRSREGREQIRLLVVEDNNVNQAVALGILENLGYRADVVGDGHSALTGLTGKDYDVVLMDCQLPRMDGYEATRQIRRRDSAVRNHDIPIIATTAHALAGDREKCLAAGMNGYVAKPLNADALERAIEEWTGGEPAPAAPAAILPAPPVRAVTTFDGDDFVERLMGDQKLAKRIVRGFMDEMPRQIASLAQAVGNRDAQQVRLVAHSIKGAAANVSGMELREAAFQLEMNGAAGDLTVAAAALPKLSDSFDRLRSALETFSRDDPAV